MRCSFLPSNFKRWLHCKIPMLPSGCLPPAAAPALFLGALSHLLLLLLASSHTLTISAASLQHWHCQNHAAKLNPSSPPYVCTSQCPHAPHVPTRISSGKSHSLPKSRSRELRWSLLPSMTHHKTAGRVSQGRSLHCRTKPLRTSAHFQTASLLLFSRISHHGKLLCA